MFGDTLKIQNISEIADLDAIIFEQAGKVTKLNYQQFEEKSQEIAEVLNRVAINRGERVLMVTENHLFWMPIFIGIASSGKIAVPLDGNTAIDRFQSILADSNPAVIIMMRKYSQRFSQYIPEDYKAKFIFEDEYEILVKGNSTSHAPADREVKPHDIAALMYTSGTTGRPKGIMLSHRALIESAKYAKNLVHCEPKDKIVTILPFSHVFALVDSGIAPLYWHCTNILCNTLNPAEMFGLILKYQSRFLLAVPRLCDLLALSFMQNPDFKLPPIDIVVGGAAPNPKTIMFLASKGVKIAQGFGMTETAAGIIFNGGDCPPTSIGKPLDVVKAKISNPVDGVGELLVSSPTLLSGIYNQPELDQTLFEDGYFKTGDLASIDEQGNIYIRGRAKEVIISGSGVNVYPDELEVRLGTLKYAEEYSIFGIVLDGLEVPAFAFVPRKGVFEGKASEDVLKFVEADLRAQTEDWPEPEKIRKIFMLGSPLPRSASTKVKRFELAEALSGKEHKPAETGPKQEEISSAPRNEQLFEAFRQEIASFLKADYHKIKLSTRLDSFIQLDSLGIIAMLLKLEKRFGISFKELIGSSVETFDDLFSFLATKVDTTKMSEVNRSETATGEDMPPLLDYSLEAIEARQKFIRNYTGNQNFALPKPDDPEAYSGNIEGFAGFVTLPIGICGPLKVKGENAEGDFYVPLATTEGALVSSVARGCQIITMSGGAEVRILEDSLIRTPVFEFATLSDLEKFSEWINNNFASIKKAADATTKFGKLLTIEQYPIGTQLVLRLVYSTGDASGQNMTTIATRAAIDYILDAYDGSIYDWFLESNLSGDKKVNSVNFTRNRGKKVVAVVRIPADIVKQFLHTTPERIIRLGELTMITSLQAHSFGVQAHYANMLAAVYIAAGQDPACVAESACGVTYMKLIDGALQVSVTLPDIMVGTVGGGTRLPTQKKCLEIMQCSGPGKAKKLAEILAATVLAGEISITGAMASDEFTNAHAKYGRNGGLNKKEA